MKKEEIKKQWEDIELKIIQQEKRKLEIIKGLILKGYTWREIGDFLGKSKQAMNQYYRNNLRKYEN